MNPLDICHWIKERFDQREIYPSVSPNIHLINLYHYPLINTNWTTRFLIENLYHLWYRYTLHINLSQNVIGFKLRFKTFLRRNPLELLN